MAEYRLLKIFAEISQGFNSYTFKERKDIILKCSILKHVEEFLTIIYQIQNRKAF